MSASARKRIVVVGAGFGGMAAVQAMKGLDADITLVDRTNHHLFQPLLYQVATAALSPAEIATATRVLLRRYRNATVLMAEVIAVEAAERRVRLGNGTVLPYDYLVLATGAAYSFFGHDEWAPYTHVLKTLDDALSIRERLLSAFEYAEESKDSEQVRRLMTFAVIGGGPTGVELAGTMAELARSTLARDFKHIDPRSARIILCEAGPRLLSAFPPRLSDYAAEALRALGVEVQLGQTVRSIDARGLLVGDTRIEVALVLWCAGTAARPAARWLGVPAARNGAVQVGADCSVPQFPEIFAIGDVASFSAGLPAPLPGLAPVAKQQGRYVGRFISRELNGRKPPGPFRYFDKGNMAVVGKNFAIMESGRIRLAGLTAWFAWAFIHLLFLPQLQNRLRVEHQWLWSYFTGQRSSRLVSEASRVGK